MHRSCKLEITPSNNKEYPPFLGNSVEDKYQHQIEHDSLTQHPKEHSSEQVVKESSHKYTRYLQVMQYRLLLIRLSELWSPRYTGRFVRHRLVYSGINTTKLTLKCGHLAIPYIY